MDLKENAAPTTVDNNKQTIETFESFGVRSSKPKPAPATYASAPAPKKENQQTQETKKKEPETTIDFFTGELVEVTEIEPFEQEERKSSPVRTSKGNVRPSRYAIGSDDEEEEVVQSIVVENDADVDKKNTTQGNVLVADDDSDTLEDDDVWGVPPPKKDQSPAQKVNKQPVDPATENWDYDEEDDGTKTEKIEPQTTDKKPARDSEDENFGFEMVNELFDDEPV